MVVFHPIFTGVPRAANRSEIWEHRKAELENPVDQPEHFPCCRHGSGGVSSTWGCCDCLRLCTGYLPGGGPFESPGLQQGEGREHGQDEEEEVLAEGGGHFGDQEGGQVAELKGGEVEKGTLGNHDRHLHEQHPTPSPQVRDGDATKTDEFSEKFQTAFDPLPPSFSENHVAIPPP